MIEVVYQREVAYPLVGRTLSQYFDLEHLEHVHPRSFGKARLVSQHHDTVVWDLEWPPIFGVLRFRNRVIQRFLPPDRIHAAITGGFLRGTNVDIYFGQTAKGTLVEEHYWVPFPNWPWLRRLVKNAWVRWLDRIWEEDLKVGVCHGGWPGVPRT